MSTTVSVRVGPCRAVLSLAGDTTLGQLKEIVAKDKRFRGLPVKGWRYANHMVLDDSQTLQEVCACLQPQSKDGYLDGIVPACCTIIKVGTYERPMHCPRWEPIAALIKGFQRKWQRDTGIKAELHSIEDVDGAFGKRWACEVPMLDLEQGAMLEVALSPEIAFFRDQGVEIRDGELVNHLRQLTQVAAFHVPAPFVTLNDIAPVLKRIVGHSEFVQALSSRINHLVKPIDALIEKNQIPYTALWYFFEVGKLMLLGKNNAVMITDFKYHPNEHMCSVRALSYIWMNGFEQTTHQFTVAESPLLLDLDDLPLHTLTKEREKELQERAQETMRWTGFLEYSGHMLLKDPKGKDLFAVGSGRVMIDPAGFREMQPNDPVLYVTHCKSLANLALLSPYLLGFSLQHKRWGRFHSGQLSNIVFSEDALEQLVLDAEKKEILTALASNQQFYKDLVGAKRHCTALLLHGPPGTGKTLTAEAVAEHLQRPLYYLPVGELGTDPKIIAQSLQLALQTAKRWDAVTLFDEADVYLEKREKGNINLTAIVSVFLKELEYHDGMIFLTTNRIDTFDPAFESRFTLLLAYSLTDKARVQIWQTLAKVHGLEFELSAEQCAAFPPLNGRQIKNVLRMVLTLAHSRGHAATHQDLVQTLKACV